MIDIVGCAQDGCDLPAEQSVIHAAPNPSGFGIILHMRVYCVDGHVTFTEQAGHGG